MSKRILIIQGHPDPHGGHFCQALAEAYARGAAEAGHELRRLDVARMDFTVLRSAQEFQDGAPSPVIREAQQDILWAQHLLIVYPLWLGTLPALLKAFFEQTFRDGFAMQVAANGRGTQHPRF